MSLRLAGCSWFCVGKLQQKKPLPPTCLVPTASAGFRLEGRGLQEPSWSAATRSQQPCLLAALKRLSSTHAGLDGELLEATGAPADEPACPPDQQRREYATLRAAAHAAQAAVRAAEAELADILQARQQQEQSATLVAAHYDAPRLQVGAQLVGLGCIGLLLRWRSAVMN